jgi:hypothetical protein
MPNDAEGINQISLVHLSVFFFFFVITAHWTYLLLFLTVGLWLFELLTDDVGPGI